MAIFLSDEADAIDPQLTPEAIIQAIENGEGMRSVLYSSRSETLIESVCDARVADRWTAIWVIHAEVAGDIYRMPRKALAFRRRDMRGAA